MYIELNFANLAIKKLQQQHVPLLDSNKIVQNIRKFFENLCDPKGFAIQNKFIKVLEKNLVSRHL